VKVPKNKIVVALGPSKAVFAGGVDLENDLAIHQQSEKRNAGKSVQPAELLDFLRVESMAMAVAIFGSQILNNAPARGDSSTISSPRRRI